MVDKHLTSTQREQLSAYLDGELPADQAAAVAARIAGDPRWQAAAAEFERLNEVLDRWTAPRMQRDLTASILAEARRKPPRPMWMRWLAPLSAAAAIVVAVMLSIDPPAPKVATLPSPGDDGEAVVQADDRPAPDAAASDDPLEHAVAALPPKDQFVVENLDVFADYHVLAHFDTLRAIAAEAVMGSPEPSDGQMVSVDQQLRMKRRLLMDEASLVATLEANRRRWEQMTPTQQEQLRDYAYAFRAADEVEQVEILAAWEAFWRMDDDERDTYRQRAAWVIDIIAALTDAERARLLALSPADRAAELLRLREASAAENAPPTTLPSER